MLEDRPDDFLPFDLRLSMRSAKWGCGCWAVIFLQFHVARDCPICAAFNLKRGPIAARNATKGVGSTF